MSDIAIRVENLSKLYHIGHMQQRDDTMRDALVNAMKRLRVGKPKDSNGEDEIWALKDVFFEVKRGEILGIIGPNGAGKSTLLKILSQITEPTTGWAAMDGRVGSLLEVGTGFHPELTGRENIYLNGAILGMTRKEIEKKFDEIVSFSENEKFLDTPVKRYSSGMYVRLAFAVAAHLEPEILLVDEVLAVGDMAFQKKCLGKLGEVAQSGRTVLFISHNLSAIDRLCQRAILLEQGKIKIEGAARDVISAYSISERRSTTEVIYKNQNKAPGNSFVRLCSVRVCDINNRTVDKVDIRQRIGIEMVYEVLNPGYLTVPNIHFHNENGIYLFVTQDLDPKWRNVNKSAGRYRSIVWIPGNFLAEGGIIVSAAVTTFEPWLIHFFAQDILSFQVFDSHDGSSARGDYAGNLPGVVRPIFDWETNKV